MNSLHKTRYALPHLALLAVSGRDAAVFLQGQLTCDVLALGDGQSCLAALCNAKGRVISVLWLAKRAQDFCLLLPASLVETVRTTLQRYVLRSQVLLLPDPSVLWAIESLEPADVPLSTEDMLWIPLPIANGYYAVMAQDQAVFADQQWRDGDALDWRRLEMEAGLPWFDSAQSALYTPHMLNLEALGAISFTKGCYTGQEIVARTHYLGKAKRGLLLATSDTALPGDCAGLSVLDPDQQPVGAVLSSVSVATKAYVLVVLNDAERPIEHVLLDDVLQTSLIVKSRDH
jgi:folate-binding protein YgfZ